MKNSYDLSKLQQRFDMATSHAFIRTDRVHTPANLEDSEESDELIGVAQSIDQIIETRQAEAKEKVQLNDQELKKDIRKSNVLRAVVGSVLGAAVLTSAVLLGVFVTPMAIAGLALGIFLFSPIILPFFSAVFKGLGVQDREARTKMVPTQEIDSIKELEQYQAHLKDPQFQDFLDDEDFVGDREAVIQALNNPHKMAHIFKAFELYKKIDDSEESDQLEEKITEEIHAATFDGIALDDSNSRKSI